MQVEIHHRSKHTNYRITSVTVNNNAFYCMDFNFNICPPFVDVGIPCHFNSLTCSQQQNPLLL